MTELRVSCVEDGVIRLCEAQEPVSRIIVDSSSSAFLAYNTVHGYSPIDFRRPDSARLTELVALLQVHADFERTRQLHAGLYLDMIWTVAPAVDVVFKNDGVVATREAPLGGAGSTAAAAGAPQARRGTPLPRARRHGWRPRVSLRSAAPPLGQPQPAAASMAPAPPVQAPSHTTLIAFGDSFVYGAEISEVERQARCFPTLLAHELGIACGANLAECGRSNDWTFRRVVDFVRAGREHLDKYFLVIGVTHPARKLFFFKDGQEYWFAGRRSTHKPHAIHSLCMELFLPAMADIRMNMEIEHKYWVLSCFLRRLGCRFVMTPCWNFAQSGVFFRGKELGKDAAFFGETREKFGFSEVANHLPWGPGGHPLSEGHALFARELAKIVSDRDLL